MTLLNALKTRLADTENRLFTDAEYSNFISLVGGNPTHDLNTRYLDLAEREVLQAILNNSEDPRFNTFREGAYGKTLDTNAMRRRIEDISRRYSRTRMMSV